MLPLFCLPTIRSLFKGGVLSLPLLVSWRIHSAFIDYDKKFSSNSRHTSNRQSETLVEENNQDAVYLFPFFQPKTAFSIESKTGSAFETNRQLESTLFYQVVYICHEIF